LVTVESFVDIDTLGIPGIDSVVKNEIDDARLFAERRKKELCEQLEIPGWVDKWSLGQYLRRSKFEIFNQTRKEKPNLSTEWVSFFWYMNESIGNLLLDGQLVPIKSIQQPPESPEWVNSGAVDLTVFRPGHPRYSSVVWRMGSGCQGGEEYELPSLFKGSIPRTEGKLPLSINKIHVFEDEKGERHSFTLVKTYDPWWEK